MPYEREKSEEVNCSNFNCKFYDDTGVFEQKCSAGDEMDNTYLPHCEKYIPEHDGS